MPRYRNDTHVRSHPDVLPAPFSTITSGSRTHASSGGEGDSSSEFERRIDRLITTMEAARDILERECRMGDAFARLALGVMEKEISALEGALALIRPGWKEEVGAQNEESQAADDVRFERDKTIGRGGFEGVSAPSRVARSYDPPARRISVGHVPDSEEADTISKSPPSLHQHSPIPHGPPTTVHSTARRPPAATPAPPSTASSRPTSRATSRAPSPLPSASSLVSEASQRPVQVVSDREEKRRPQVGGASRRTASVAAASTTSASDSDASVSGRSGIETRIGVRASAKSKMSRRATRPSTPPVEVEEEQKEEEVATPPKTMAVLDDPHVLRCIAGILQDQGLAKTLASLAQTSKAVARIVTPTLYDRVVLSSRVAVELLSQTLESTATLVDFVRECRILPLDGDKGDPSVYIVPLQHLLRLTTSLRSLDEDMTEGDWDVLHPATDHPLTPTTSAPLTYLNSHRCWFEIGAVYSLLQSQPNLHSLVFGGAVMDREWEGNKILSQPPRVLCPSLTSLEVGQIMHEDTLEVILRSCSDSLISLRVGFQTIGSTDDDTPRESIPKALAHVGNTLRHLSIRAPTKESESTAGLIEECLDVLPHLEILEINEHVGLLPLALATSKSGTRLPSTVGQGLWGSVRSLWVSTDWDTVCAIDSAGEWRGMKLCGMMIGG